MNAELQKTPEPEYFELPGAAGELIRGYVHLPPGQKEDGKLPVLLLAHGFKGFCDYGFLPLMAETLSAAGIAVIRFSFSHCGVTGADGDDFDRPDLFEHDSFSRQITDVLKIIDGLLLGKIPASDRLDNDRIAMAGHSRGGVTAVLTTGKTDHIKALITLASPSECLSDPKMREKILSKGRIESPSGRTGQMLYIGRDYVEDIQHAGDCYDLSRRMELFTKPYMAVHCRGDTTVSFQCSEKLAAAHGGDFTELIILEEGGHTFDFRHGQSDSTAALDITIEKMNEFLRQALD